jgi:hypothetical protein
MTKTKTMTMTGKIRYMPPPYDPLISLLLAPTASQGYCFLHLKQSDKLK